MPCFGSISDSLPSVSTRATNDLAFFPFFAGCTIGTSIEAFFMVGVGITVISSDVV